MSMIVVGGSSGGGLNLSKSLIHVKAPLDSDVSFTKGSMSKLVPAKKSIPDTDGVNAHYFYQTTDYGTWSVSTIISNSTSSKDVLLEQAYQYDINLD